MQYHHPRHVGRRSPVVRRTFQRDGVAWAIVLIVRQIAARGPSREFDRAGDVGIAHAVHAKLERVEVARTRNVLGLHPQLSHGRSVDWHRFALEDRVGAIAGTVVNRTGSKAGTGTRQDSGETRTKEQLGVGAQVTAAERVELDAVGAVFTRVSRCSGRSRWSSRSGRSLESFRTQFSCRSLRSSRSRASHRSYRARRS